METEETHTHREQTMLSALKKSIFLVRETDKNKYF